MPFIPHTDEDIAQMLATVGVNAIDDLFDEIPAHLKIDRLQQIPDGVNEMTLMQEMAARAKSVPELDCFIGAGAYQHHIPAAVWDIASRGEFMTAYTPYQAEASQGSLQLLYEFQSMMASLTGMDIANASLYDGASSVAEAVLMAVRANRRAKSRRVLIPQTLHPAYRRVVRSIVTQQGIEITEIPFDAKSGQCDFSLLDTEDNQSVAALVIPQPNFFGVIEDMDRLTDWAHRHQALAIAVVNPMALALIKEPGSWGEQGADIVCGEGQPLGVPLACGGPYFGFMACKKALTRQMPGRIVGRSQDRNGKLAYTLTLQAREQHIRRSKATSNICTNQGLLVSAATIYLSLMGSEGMFGVAAASHANNLKLQQLLLEEPRINAVFDAVHFHEIVLRLPQPVEAVLAAMAKRGFLGGYPLGRDYPQLQDCILVCTTEVKTPACITRYVNTLLEVLDTEIQAENQKVACYDTHL